MCVCVRDHSVSMVSSRHVWLQVKLQDVGPGHTDPAVVLPPQVRAAESQINQLIEKRMMKSEPMDDKLTLYRQQVEKIALVLTLEIQQSQGLEPDLLCSLCV